MEVERRLHSSATRNKEWTTYYSMKFATLVGHDPPVLVKLAVADASKVLGRCWGDMLEQLDYYATKRFAFSCRSAICTSQVDLAEERNAGCSESSTRNPADQSDHHGGVYYQLEPYQSTQLDSLCP